MHEEIALILPVTLLKQCQKVRMCKKTIAADGEYCHTTKCPKTDSRSRIKHCKLFNFEKK